MAYALKYQKYPGVTPDFLTANNFADIVQIGIGVLDAGQLLLGVSHGPDDYPCRAADVRAIRETRARTVKEYADAGITIRYQ